MKCSVKLRQEYDPPLWILPKFEPFLLGMAIPTVGTLHCFTVNTLHCITVGPNIALLAVNFIANLSVNCTFNTASKVCCITFSKYIALL